MKSPKKNWLAILGGVATLLAVGIGLGVLGFRLLHQGAPGQSAQSAANKASESLCTSRASRAIGGPIQLIDDQGAMISEADFKGKPTLVFFGFTYCPDVCPFSLQKMAAFMDQGGWGAKDINTLLISVDPERDNPGALHQYVGLNGFPPGLRGATATEPELGKIARSFGAFYRKVDQPDSAIGYTMDHTSLIYLMDAQWNFKTFFTSSDDPLEVQQCLRETIEAKP